MNTQLQKIKQFRLFILNAISDLSAEELNKIPEGFRNNIIWNLAHLISASQMIFYKRAGLAATIDDKYILPFLPTTYPVNFVEADEIDTIKALAIKTIDDMQRDGEIKNFDNYTLSENIQRVYNIQVASIQDAVEFLLYHEGYHIGKIIALKHLIN